MDLKHRTLNINRNLIKVHKDEILSQLGGKKSGSDHHILTLIDSTISDCKKVMAPQGGYASFKAIPSGSQTEIAIEGTLFHTGKILRKMLHRSEEYLFFIATAGPGPEELSRSLINGGQFLEGYIADLVGSAIAESVAQLLHEHIKEEAALRGKKVTNRYSPGYCGWDVVEQQKLFGLFPEGTCGISLSGSSLMSPIKSISGVIGNGQSVCFREYTCEICSMKNCSYRRTRLTNPPVE